jgi:hypothetical protein
VNDRPELPVELAEVPEIRMSPLTVEVDVVALLERFDGDEAKAFEFLGKLKDLLS